jgi:hypothetical protein
MGRRGNTGVIKDDVGIVFGKKRWSPDHVRALCKRYKIDPIEELIKLYPHLSIPQRINILTILSAFTYPRLATDKDNLTAKKISPSFIRQIDTDELLKRVGEEAADDGDIPEPLCEAVGAEQ